MLSSFTKDEKKILVFATTIIVIGVSFVIINKPKPVPLFLDSYQPQTTGTLAMVTSGTLAATISANGTIDLNSADGKTLAAVPGIGPKLAEEIISYRTAHGAFRSYEELDNVKGVGPAKLMQIRPHVTVGQATAGAQAVETAAAGAATAGAPSGAIASAPRAAVMPSTPAQLQAQSQVQAQPGVLAQTQPRTPPQTQPSAPQAMSYAAPARSSGSSRLAPSADSQAVVNINTATETELATLKRVGPVLAKRIIEYRAQHGAFQSVDRLQDVKGIGPKTLEDNRARLTVR